MQVAEVGDIARQWKELREYLKQNSLKVPSINIIESNRSSQLSSNTSLQGHEFSTVIKVLVQIGGKEEASVVCCG
jgi:ABC-type phosphate transport system auxiliary subunit